ncbi:RNA dependent RNA polymerase [Paenibacillus polymyxa]|uniref:RNA dependent RNA polymerase n=1 Tax=Paenibacillus polymyxa TaxID=1406 RepID=UPI002AB3A9CF|nr:hypothetical protein [Paenibacillus polymyxa]MDY8023395.1 hypothetical protein [Paenibacillus polymyxa]
MKTKTIPYNIVKIHIDQLIESDYNLSIDYSEYRHLFVEQQNNAVLQFIMNYRRLNNQKTDCQNRKATYHLSKRYKHFPLINYIDLKVKKKKRIIPYIDDMIFVEAPKNKKKDKHLEHIIRNGFIFNNKKYVRYSIGSEGVTNFVVEDISADLIEASQLGVKPDTVVTSKYEAQRNLLFTSCTFVKGRPPYIVIIDEYKKTLKDQYIRYAKLTPMTGIDKETGKEYNFTDKKIEEGYHDVEISPFDGFGVHKPHVFDVVLGQIRRPFMKGVSVEAPIEEFYAERGVTHIIDVFGKSHSVEDIDCIWNVSMWKAYGLFKNTFPIELGKTPWDEYLERIHKYGLEQIGISKYSHDKSKSPLKTRMNFQYLQCLDLDNPKYIESFNNKDKEYDILDIKNDGKMVKLARYTTDIFEKIINGDLFYTLKLLGIGDTQGYTSTSNYINAILTNPIMVNDPSVKSSIRRLLEKQIKEAKQGKIYVDGFYHTGVGDIIGYLEYAAGLPVVGCLKAGEVFVKTLPVGEVVSFRSPLMDVSEVNKVNIVENDITKKYFDYFTNQDVVMFNMYDLSLPQQGGADLDGDGFYLCNNKVIIDSVIERPIVIDVEDKATAKSLKYNIDAIVKFELNSRDSRIGEITNTATSLINQRSEDEKTISFNKDSIAFLRLAQGKEIDYRKTGLRWSIPKWMKIKAKKLPHFLIYKYPKKKEEYEKIKKKNKEFKDKGIDKRLPYNVFDSPSAMNELCRYVEKWYWERGIWKSFDVVNNGHLLIDKKIEPNLTDKQLMKEIKIIISNFNAKYKQLINQGERGKALNNIFTEYEELLHSIHSNKKELANYVINISYANLSSDKVLCWSLFGNEMLSNLQHNTDSKYRYQIEECDKETEGAREFLGRYYTFKETVKEKCN